MVAYRGGAPVRLEEVANVIDSVEDDKNVSKIYGGEFGSQGTRGVNLQVMRQPGSNTIEVTDNIKRLLSLACGPTASGRPPVASAATGPRTFAKRSRTSSSPCWPLSRWWSW